VRIASKSVNPDTAAPVSALSGKSSGGSFLDILLSGTGVGIQLPQNVARVTAKFEADSGDQPATEDANAQGSAKADADAGTSAPATPNPTAAIQTANPQNGSEPSGAGSQSPVQTTAAFLASSNLDAAQWLAKNANAIAPTVMLSRVSAGEQTSGSTKATGSTQESRGKSAATATASTGAGLSPILVAPAPLALEAALRTPQSSSTILGDALPAMKPAVASQDGQDTPNGANKAPIAPTEQAPSNLSQILAANLADATQAAPQDDAQGQAANAAQISSLQAAIAANVAASNTFLSAQALPKGADFQQVSGTQYKSVGSTLPLSSAASNSAAGVSSAANPAKSGSQAADNSSSNGQGSGSTQTAAAQASAVVRPIDNSALQTVAFTAPSTSHQAAADHGPASGTENAPHSATASENLPSEPLNASGTAGSSGINSARVIQSMSETEMRVGMRSTEFGDISIRTMVTQQQVQAQISVDHGELGNVLSSHIPAMQAKFGSELGLHATVEVNQSGMSFSGERGQSSPQQQRAFVQSVPAESAGTIVDNDPLPLRAPPAMSDGSRLDIRA
jgi:hypothetical protein